MTVTAQKNSRDVPLPRGGTVWFLLAAAMLCWLLMQAAHELGHVLHALLSGGTVVRVLLHPATISRTDVAPNPHPVFVLWGGFLWGSALPVLAWAVAKQRHLRPFPFLELFAGFCLIANGAYLTTGLWFPVGDTRELVMHGTPALLLFAVGLLGVVAGLWLWHRLDRRLRTVGLRSRLSRRDVLWATAILAVIVVVECIVSLPV